MGGGGLISNRVCVRFPHNFPYIFSYLYRDYRRKAYCIGYVVFVLSISANVMVDVKMGTKE
jgi:hypothetical protein